MALEDLRCIPRELVECVCPRCGQIYQRKVDREHATSEFAFRVGGRLVITCEECRPESDFEDIYELSYLINEQYNAVVPKRR